MKYLIFDTEASAIAAEAQISADLGLSKPGINAATGEVTTQDILLEPIVPQPTED